jgi:hypothetical protein
MQATTVYLYDIVNVVYATSAVQCYVTVTVSTHQETFSLCIYKLQERKQCDEYTVYVRCRWHLVMSMNWHI